MNLKLLIVLLCLMPVLYSSAAEKDWRKSATDKEKLQNVINVMPGASSIMLQMGQRYSNLYWAAKQGKWAFANYQLEEIEELIATLMITRPKRAATAGAFLKTAFTHLPVAIKNQDQQQFDKAFTEMRNRCMQCHIQNDHAYIVLAPVPRKGNSPILD